ncbi:MAG: right-handed parallel beta-helix repeat-containing protein [Phycisphaerales bacterium]
MTRKFLLLASGFALAAALASTAHAKPSLLVDCDAVKDNDIQAAVDGAAPGDTVFISGTCNQDVTITKDDITLSGNEAEAACDKGDPSVSAAGTIDGTVTVHGVRAKIEHLVITGGGAGVLVTNRADARLTCNDISDNQESGVNVIRTSNAVLTDNTLSSNGQRGFEKPFVFFDVGLFLGTASSVESNGNTYEDNQYAAIESDRQSGFRNARFLPRESGHPPIAAEKDTIIQKGNDPTTGSCNTDFNGPVAIAVFNNGLVDLKHADVCGGIDVSVNSTFRIDDGGGTVIGNVSSGRGSWVRIRDRSGLGDGRLTTFNGTLNCSNFSGTFGSNVKCEQTCSGAIPVTCAP